MENFEFENNSPETENGISPAENSAFGADNTPPPSESSTVPADAPVQPVGYAPATPDPAAPASPFAQNPDGFAPPPPPPPAYSSGQNPDGFAPPPPPAPAYSCGQNPDGFPPPPPPAPAFQAGQTYVPVSAGTPTISEPPKKVEFNTEDTAGTKKPASNGLKIFAGILAAVLIIAVTCTIGYNLGATKSNSSGLYGQSSMKVYPKPADTDEMSPQEVYDKVNPSIVGIVAYNEDGNASQATGVVYTDNEYILTNDHIYSNVPLAKFKIYTSDGKSYDAEYVAGDTVSDLALLKVKNATGLKKPEFGDSTQLQFGERVVAIGRPGNARGASSISTGVISSTLIRAQITSNYTVNMIQTDCDIFEGSSGGALVNMYGQIVGITSSKSTDGGSSMSFAIPVKTVQRVAPQLSENGKVVDRAKLGITYREISELEAQLNDSDYCGLYITDISSDSDMYGKVQPESVITHINGKKITDANIVLDIIDDSKANDTVKLTIVDKNGKQADHTVKLKANIGESSYSTEKKSTDDLPEKDDNNDPKEQPFSFPKGE